MSFNPLVRSLTPEQRRLLGDMLLQERLGGIHDVLAVLTDWMSSDDSRLRWSRELTGRRRRLRQIVSEKDFDADALLIGNDRFAQATGKQDSGRGAGFVPGILIDDGVGDAAEQKSSGIGG